MLPQWLALENQDHAGER